MSRLRYIIFLFTALVCLSACGEPKQERIQRLLDERLRIERLRLEKKCRIELITKASAAVDSFIIERALSDTTHNYIRPMKPDVPNLEIPDIDTLGIKPLFVAPDTIE